MEPGFQIGDRYTLIRQLGEGAAKEVFLARDEILQREVALCVFKPQVLSEGYLERIRREARTLAGLSHPHIVGLYDFREDDGCYLVTEYVAGGTLKSKIASDWKDGGDLDEVLRIAAEVADALAETHAKAIFHRDIKPSNVLLTRDGTAKLGDFGLAVPHGGGVTGGDGLLIGTLAYMSPEQVKCLPPDSPSDMYSFGVMLFEMVAGRRPFYGEDASILVHHQESKPPPPIRYVPDCPPRLEALILQLLGKEPEARPTASEAADELRRIRGERSTDSTPTKIDDPTRAYKARAAALLVLGLTVGLMAWWRPWLPDETNCVVKLAEVFSGNTEHLGFRVVARSDVVGLKGKITIGTLPAISDPRNFELARLLSASGCERNGELVPLVIIDDIDEIHPDSSRLILRSLDKLILDLNQPKADFLHVFVLGGSEGFAPWYRDPKRHGGIAKFLRKYELKGPVYSTTGDLEILARNVLEFQHGTAPSQSLVDQFIQYVRRHRFLSYSIRSLSVTTMISDRSATSPDDTEFDLKEFLLGELLERSSRLHGRPEPGDQQYRGVLEQITLRYASRLDSDGFFVVGSGDKVSVPIGGGDADEVHVRTVLEHSGIAITIPGSHSTARYRFEPVWVQAHLFELANRRAAPGYQYRSCSTDPPVPLDQICEVDSRLAYDISTGPALADELRLLYRISPDNEPLFDHLDRLREIHRDGVAHTGITYIFGAPGVGKSFFVRNHLTSALL